MLQEQDEATRARRYRFFEAEQKRETYPLPETKENPIVQVNKGRNYFPIFNRNSGVEDI